MKSNFFSMIVLMFCTNLIWCAASPNAENGAKYKGSLVIKNVNFWVTGDGDDGMMHTIGIVQNVSDITCYKVRLKIFYLDANNKPINVDGWLSELKGELDGSNSNDAEGDIATVETVMIAPNSQSYFHQFRSVKKIKGKVHNVRIEYENVEKMKPEYFISVTNLSVNPEIEAKTIWDGTKVKNDYGMRIKGVLKNMDKAPCDKPKLAILFYGADGKIWGDRVVDFTLSGMNSVKLSKTGSLEANEEVSFDILCDHPQIDLNGKIVKIAKVEVIGYKDIPYFSE